MTKTMPRLSVVLTGLLPGLFYLEDNRYMSIHVLGILLLGIILLCAVVEMGSGGGPRLGPAHLGVALFLAVLFFSLFRVDQPRDLGNALALILVLLLMGAMAGRRLTSGELRFLLASPLWVGTGLSVGMLILRTPYSQLETNRITFPLLNGQVLDPNYIGGFLAGALSVCLLYGVLLRRKWPFLCALPIFAAVVMTGSRSAFLAAGIALAVGGVYVVVSPFPTRQKVFLALLLTGGLAVLGMVFFSSLFSSYAKRLFSTYLDRSNLFRVQAWLGTWKLIGEKPLFGYGNQPVSQLNRLEIFGYIYYMDPHSTPLNIAFQFGMVGLTGFGMICAGCVRQAMAKGKWILFSLLASTFFSSLIVSNQRTMYFWYFLLLAYVAADNFDRFPLRAGDRV